MAAVRLTLIAFVLAFSALAVASPLAGPQPSPQDRLIAFARWDGIYVIRADGGGERALWRGGPAAGVSRLAWSPDGRRLAFSNRRNELWVIDADGSRPVRMVTAAEISAKVILGPLTWLPGGRRIGFTAIHAWSAGEKAREWDIYAVDPDGTGAKRLSKTPRVYEFDVDWSPAGDRIAVTDMAGMFAHLRVMTTGGTIRGTANPGSGWEIAMPDWSPDGRRLAFIEWPNFVDGSGSLNDAEIWVTTPNGRWRRLTWNRVADSNPVWSPDGRRIAFVRGRDPGSMLYLPAARCGSAEIYVMNADGGGVTRLTHDDAEETSPAWQPVGGTG